MDADTFIIDIQQQTYRIVAYEQPQKHYIIHEVWDGEHLLFTLVPRFDETPADCWRTVPEHARKYFGESFIHDICYAIESYWA